MEPRQRLLRDVCVWAAAMSAAFLYFSPSSAFCASRSAANFDGKRLSRTYRTENGGFGRRRPSIWALAYSMANLHAAPSDAK